MKNKNVENSADIYVCLTVFHVYVALLNIFNNKKHTLLILTDNIVDVKMLAKNIKLNINFIDVEIIDNLQSREKIIKSLKKRIFYNSFLSYYYAEFINKYDDILSHNSINIFNDTEYFNMFLLNKYKKFNLLEDGVWMHPPLKKDIKYFIKYYLLRQPKKFGHSSKIKNIIVQDIQRLPNELQNKGKIYSISNLQKRLEDLDIEKLKSIFLINFGVNDILTSQEKMIVLTQPISEENYITEEEKIEVYKKIIDEYNKNNSYKVFIKNHPRDLTDYTKYIKGISVIPAYIPFEIFLLDDNISFDIGITIWSSSIYNVDFIKEKIFLGQDYIKDISKRDDY